jgi:hypothetical protein
MLPQAAGMSCSSVAEEITSICADFLVELRGFEPRCSCPSQRLKRPSVKIAWDAAVTMAMKLVVVAALERCLFTVGEGTPHVLA